MGVEKLRQAFLSPGREFGPTPFFGLNDDLQPERLRAALEQFAAKGCAGIFMHARTGLEIPYLSETWWERIGFILEECRRLGLKAWIYDEYNWPSGPAGGHALAGHPEFLMPCLQYVWLNLERGENRPAHGRAVAAFLVNNTIKDISDCIKDSRLERPDKEGRVLLFYEDVVSEINPAVSNAPWCGEATGYLDLMNPDAVEHFLHLTHRQYVRRFPDHIGTTIPGIFTDEPQFYRGFPWTAALPSLFRTLKGYDLIPLLYLLVLERGDFRRLRCDFYEVVEHQYASAFYEPVRRFCDEHGLIFTGHLGMEERLHELAVNHGGIWRPLKAMSMPGIDALGDGNPVHGGLINMASPHFSPRAAAVISRIFSNGQVLAETGGGSGWEATLFSLKLQLDWLFASGVTFINPHHSLLSIKGHRKRDFPPFHSPAEPWFEFYQHWTEYTARLSRLMSTTQPEIEIGLLVPVSALRSLCAGRGLPRSAEAKQILFPFQVLMEFLVRHQRDYELVFEEAAEEGVLRLQGDRLSQGVSRYRLLIVPPSNILRPAMAEMIVKFLEAGGRMIFFDALPHQDTSGRDLTPTLLPAFRRAAEAGRAFQLSSSTGFSRKGVLAAIDRLCPPPAWLPAPGNEAIIVCRRRAEEGELYFLANLSENQVETEVCFRHSQPVLERWNPASGESVRLPWSPAEGEGVRIRMEFAPGQSFVLVWHAERPETDKHVHSASLVVREYDGSRLRGWSRDGRAVVETPHGRIEREYPTPPLPLTLPLEWEISPGRKNVLLLEPWKVRTDKIPPRPIQLLDTEHYFSRRTRQLIRFGRPVIQVAQFLLRPEKRYRTERYFNFSQAEQSADLMSRLTGINLQRWGLYEGVEALTHLRDYLGFRVLMQPFPPPGAEYEAEISFFVEYIPEDLTLVFEDLGERVEFELNGKVLAGEAGPAPGWDPCCRGWPVAALVRRGKNALVMRSRQLSYLTTPPHAHSLEPVALMGSFGVKEDRLIEPDRTARTEGDWSGRGYPFYSGLMEYRARFDVPSEYMDFALVLEFTEVRECAEVFLNGIPLGVRIFPPFAFPVGEAVQPSENELLARVVNTGANFFSRPSRSGIIGPVRLVPWARCELELGGEES